jgi:hypothetical protein
VTCLLISTVDSMSFVCDGIRHSGTSIIPVRAGRTTDAVRET